MPEFSMLEVNSGLIHGKAAGAIYFFFKQGRGVILFSFSIFSMTIPQKGYLSKSGGSLPFDATAGELKEFLVRNADCSFPGVLEREHPEINSISFPYKSTKKLK